MRYRLVIVVRQDRIDLAAANGVSSAREDEAMTIAVLPAKRQLNDFVLQAKVLDHALLLRAHFRSRRRLVAGQVVDGRDGPPTIGCQRGVLVTLGLFVRFPGSNSPGQFKVADLGGDVELPINETDCEKWTKRPQRDHR